MRTLIAWFAMMILDAIGDHWNIEAVPKTHENFIYGFYLLALILCIALDVKELFK